MANSASSKFSNYTIYAAHQYMTWDKGREPAITVAPGDVVEFRDIDAVCGQLSPDSSVADLGSLDFERVNPVAGPAKIAEYLFEINAISLAEAREDGYDPRINERMQKIK